MKLTVFAILLVNALAVAAQDPNTTGGQAGSVVSDPNVPATTQSPTTTPPAAPVVNPATTSAPVFGAPAPPAPWIANPAPLTDSSGSSSFGSAGDIEPPTTRKPKRVTDSPRSPSSTPTPEDSSASTSSGAWFVAVLALGLASML
ncbi:hypothetical protein V7S43_001846 [Phytophthora oleae]|uniref:RxLR effector protein n=1 Tax=Phytophthora oleae TaxID=2107226 RepID=A0ABD3G3Y5_9STRA